MAVSRKMQALVTALSAKTISGEVKWKTGSRDDAFIWSGTSASVILSTKDGDGEAPWVVRIVDSDGRTVESEVVDIYHELYAQVDELYALSRASALNIDKTIDELLDDLSDPF